MRTGRVCRFLWFPSFFGRRRRLYMAVSKHYGNVFINTFWEMTLRVSCGSTFYLILMIFMAYFSDSNIISNAKVSDINTIIAWKAQTVLQQRTPHCHVSRLFLSYYFFYFYAKTKLQIVRSTLWWFIKVMGDQAHQLYELQICFCLINSQ